MCPAQMLMLENAKGSLSDVTPMLCLNDVEMTNPHVIYDPVFYHNLGYGT
uniref:Uncharacterized protein n=1 Tax=Arundo donax TaxID=35708 RepID=A0A0A8YIH1_ARUDO